MSDHKVIGHIAYLTKLEIVCDGDSCLVAGSSKKMKSYLEQRNPDASDKVTIVKARFREIMQGMMRGGAYSFDEESYNRFYPLAAKAGMKIGLEDFSGETPTGLHFVRVQKMDISTN
jgi:hypothetical protein